MTPTVRIALALALVLACGTARAERTTPDEAAERRRAAAAAAFALVRAAHASSRATVENVYTWSRRLLRSEAATSPKRKALLEAQRAHQTRMKQLLEEVERQHLAGNASATDKAFAEYYAAEAAHWLARRKGR